MEVSNSWKKYLAISGVLLGGLIFTAFEVVSEDEDVSVAEFIIDTLEKALIITGAAGVVHLLYQSKREQEERLKLLRELEVARNEGREWRSKVQGHMNGVGEEIDRQFSNWNLSDAEAEVGLFMIKGLTHKEIADLRGTAEATVRQQARSVYQKSGIQGKAAFCAFFLEDLLPPQQKQQLA